MRLSDENLRDIIALNASYTSIRLLAEEVLALRKCEEALADLEANGTRVLDVNHHAGQSVWTAVQDLAASLIRARAALAAVRELEQP